jgi:hypothetical protein
MKQPISPGDPVKYSKLGLDRRVAGQHVPHPEKRRGRCVRLDENVVVVHWDDGKNREYPYHQDYIERA